ncbi:MAG: N-acetylmuramoyl-L-alanine amidase [Myxococcales bacterium]|nr:N-acetylmuramoyl-L-alanine amidase [Myxococcales bacterium]
MFSLRVSHTRVLVWFLSLSLLLIFQNQCIPGESPTEKSRSEGISILDGSISKEGIQDADPSEKTEVASPETTEGQSETLPEPNESSPELIDPPLESAERNPDAEGNCNQEDCISPPLAICLDSNTQRLYDAQGTCHPTEDRCVYTYTDKTCNGLCKNGQCFDQTDLCNNTTCDTPSAPKCLSGTVLRTYKAPGTCKDGVCAYTQTDTTCNFGCKDGNCLTDPCANVSCKTPTASKCISATTIRNYYNPGTCNKGTCTYPHADQTCPHGCQGDQCKLGPGFTPLTPFRFLDTRGSATPASDSTTCVQITGKGGVPSTAKAVYVNLVAVGPTGPGFLTAYPKGIAQPTVSSLNYTTGQTVANGAIVAVGTGGQICIFVKTATHTIIDVSGYFESTSDFFPKGPYRRLDTRSGTKPGDQSTQCYKVAGQDGIPSDAKAVFVNLVAVEATAAGFLSLYPKGIARPTASTLNYTTDGATANGALVRLGTGGEICVYAYASTHIILDVTGYFGALSSLSAIDPIRRLDTRTTSLPADQSTQCHQVTGRDGIPATAKALAINVTAAGPSKDGFITVYTDGSPRPNTSTLNYQQGISRANNALVQPSSNGKICIYTTASTHIILDITGYWEKTTTGDPCSGITCNTPPPTTCVGGKVLASYAKTGTCQNGTCLYQETSTSCSWQCVGAQCIPAPPPPPTQNTYHPVTSWQTASQPVTSGSRMNILDLRYITLHYNGGNLDLDGSDNVYQDADFVQILRNMQNSYLVSRGYSLGYNSAIAPDGDEWEIRGLTYRSAANGCTSVNRPGYTIIIPVSTVTTPLNAAQIQGVKAAIARVRAAAKAAGNNNTLTINGHRDVRPLCGNGGTACPGNSIYGLIQNGTFK